MIDKEGIPRRLWEVITTLTDNMQQAATRKAQESGFDLEVGEIPFQETLINLSHDRDVLRDAIDKGRIVQIPLKLQIRLLAEATKVKTHLDAIAAGTDAVEALEQAVEDLHATIWQFNLQNLSPEILSFESKMNDLKAQETKIKQLLSESRKLADAIDRLNELREKGQGSLNELVQNLEDSQKLLNEITSLRESVEEAERKTLSSASIIAEHQSEIAAAAASIRATSADLTETANRSAQSADEIVGLHGEFKELTTAAKNLVSTTTKSLEELQEAHHNDVETIQEQTRTELDSLLNNSSKQLSAALASTKQELEAAIDEGEKAYGKLEAEASASEDQREKKAAAQLTSVVADFVDAKENALENYKDGFHLLKIAAEANIEKHDKEAERLTKYLAELEGRIHDSIERATGYTLFHSFQKRQQELKNSKYIWAIALLVCVCGSALLSWFFIHSLGGGVHEFNPIFFMKLSISLPIIFAITFCSVQYSKERRLEEEYAFKSNISISLEPYQKLVGSLVNQQDEGEKAKYTAFIISSINRVFTSPTGLVFDDNEKDGGTANTLLKTAGNIAETLVKSKIK